MITLNYVLTLSGILFAIAVAGVFLNRKNVFFILTVAAAESAIGLAILVVVFRERRSIEVEDLDTLQG